AERDLTYALTLNPREWLALYLLATLDYRDGDYEAAIRRFTDASKIAPTRSEILYYRAVTYHEMGDDEKAVADIDRVLQMLPEGQKRRKDATAWLREFKKSLPGPSRSAAAEAKKAPAPAPAPSKLNAPPDRLQLSSGGTGTEKT